MVVQSPFDAIAVPTVTLLAMQNACMLARYFGLSVTRDKVLLVRGSLPNR